MTATTNERVSAAYLAVIDEAEARLAAAEARIAALEAAARATIAVAEYQSIDRDLECLLCLVERGAHEATCPVGVLAALVEEP